MASIITFAEKDHVRRILQNVKTLLGTIQGTVPLDEDFGISPDAIDQPLPVAQLKISSDIVVKIARYEPRAEVAQIVYTANEEGQLVPKVTLRISGSEYSILGGIA